MEPTALRQDTYPEYPPANEPWDREAESLSLRKAIEASWSAIAPFWPLRNLVAVNPLQGLEDLPMEQALVEAEVWFQQRDVPAAMDRVNRETIKWCQAFFDAGQATLAMPLRSRGLFGAWRALAPTDRRLHRGDAGSRAWLQSLPEDPQAAIAACLRKLGVDRAHRTQFMMLLLTTLPGWASHVRYRLDWCPVEGADAHPVSGADYLAMRLAITCVLWPDARKLLDWHRAVRAAVRGRPGPLAAMQEREAAYREPLLRQLVGRAVRPESQRSAPLAQLVFCIDVRSEPFRRALEAAGDYETLGFAGFFGVPIRVDDVSSGESHASCPVLLEPRHRVSERPERATASRDVRDWKQPFRQLYPSLKYTFAAPFALVETLGMLKGIWMALLSLAPGVAERLQRRVVGIAELRGGLVPDVEGIPMADRCSYAENALRTMGLTHGFARVVVLCAHGATTRNNAFASALDCGACGGRHGATNARVLAAILNDPWVREHLIGRGIRIPGTTRFIAALHDTATDEVSLFAEQRVAPRTDRVLRQLRQDLESARRRNGQRRAQELGYSGTEERAARHTWRRSRDWAQVRPEWGLARNAAFIAAPRELTRGLDLQGRAFLHSYDWRQDPDGEALTQILTAPMVVAQWINAQYLFSTLDNVSFGAGSKVTKNVTGKIGVMQGNASDLMHGLPLQSVFANDGRPYHEPMRLLTVVQAPREQVEKVVAAQPVLRKLLGNGWVSLACIDPRDQRAWMLQRDLSSWREAA